MIGSLVLRPMLSQHLVSVALKCVSGTAPCRAAEVTHCLFCFLCCSRTVSRRGARYAHSSEDYFL